MNSFKGNQMLKHIKISSKIYILGFTQLLLMLIMGGIAISQMSKIGVELVDIAEKNIPLSSSITALTEHQLEQSILIERALFTVALTKPSIYSSSSTSLSTDKHYKEIIDHIDKLSKTIKNEIRTIESTTKNVIDTLHTEAAKTEYRSVLTQLNTIKIDADDFINEGQALLAFIEKAPVDEIAKKALHLEEKGYCFCCCCSYWFNSSTYYRTCYFKTG